jgi:Domain of unknown function (DUF4396)
MAHVYPDWLNLVAWAALGLGFACALYIVADEFRHKQMMRVMYLVWPITALYMGPFAVVAYRRSLARMKDAMSATPSGGAAMKIHGAMAGMESMSEKPRATFWQVAESVFHCGAGCTVGDVIGEVLVPLVGIAALSGFWAKTAVDFALAYAFGIAFQYFTIVPMRHLSFAQGIVAAVRADTISISLFEAGMVVWMGFLHFGLGMRLRAGEPLFWFMMQIAMVAGSIASYPANVWLIRKGWKEAMM